MKLDTARWVLALLAAASLAQAPAKDPLARARTSYNAGQYTEAIEAAELATHQPSTANAANVVLARAYLERFRVGYAKGDQAPVDLSRARDALKAVDANALTMRDRVEYFTGLGESLYLEHKGGGPPLYGAAAEMFDRALVASDAGNPEARESLFEWWAGALDLQAQLGADSERRTTYARVLSRAEQELRAREHSASATYWIAAGARGIDDLERAWGAAIAGWIRAPQTGPAGDKLRSDLDRLVTYAIIPERARHMTPVGDPASLQAVLVRDWDSIKQRWAR